jgi:Holliday junction resolvasome RuvABC DNA-binding subunit
MKSNPRLKRLLLEVVDNQMRENEPPITRETFERLKTLGYSEQQAKEKIATVLVGDIYDVMKDNKPHDAEKYEKQLQSLK